MFGKILRTLREEKNISQKDMAKYLQISRQAYNYYELGRREPSYDTLKKLSDFFEVTTDFLLGRTDQRTPKDSELPTEFETPEEAMKFILEQNVIMGFGGFDIDKMDDDEKIEFANELLNQLRLISYKYKK